MPILILIRWAVNPIRCLENHLLPLILDSWFLSDPAGACSVF